jgi:hypothetical protein
LSNAAEVQAEEEMGSHQLSDVRVIDFQCGSLEIVQRCCKGNLTILRRILHLDIAKENPKRIL